MVHNLFYMARYVKKVARAAKDHNFNLFCVKLIRESVFGLSDIYAEDFEKASAVAARVSGV
jgi:hypothetical protein